MEVEKLKKAVGPKWREWAEKKQWRSLTDLKEHIVRHNLEKVISFDGAELVTNKATYGLYQGKISIYPN